MAILACVVAAVLFASCQRISGLSDLGIVEPKDGGKPTGSGGLTGCFPLQCGSPTAKCGIVPDGCGNKNDCGKCPMGQVCKSGECAAQAFCGNTTCEDGENCATCASDCGCNGSVCMNDKCCVPNCPSGKCGSDGCAGVCDICQTGHMCLLGKCEVAASCGNLSCESGFGENCESCPLDCACASGFCIAGKCCNGDCGTKQCGLDECGTSCGTCAAGEVCNSAGTCEAQALCGNSKCEPGENCSSCSADCQCAPAETCSPEGTCCAPNCVGKQCGSDGCGSQCLPGCSSGMSCTINGNCVGCGDGTCNGTETCSTCAGDCICGPSQVCAGGSCCNKNCGTKTCGADDCGNSNGCGSCPTGQVCQGGICKPSVACGDGTCTAGSENCNLCPQDCPVPAGKRCCTDGSIQQCCTDENCFSDPSLCITAWCNAGTCQTENCPIGANCCCSGLCEPCGGIGGFGGFQNLACAP